LSAHVDGDPLVEAVVADASRVEVLRHALVAIATEAASIAYELHKKPLGREAERARSRRLDALVAVAKIQAMIAAEEQGEPPRQVVERVTEIWLRDVAHIASEVLDGESVTALMRGVRARIDARCRG
jgi:hypothetical protein